MYFKGLLLLKDFSVPILKTKYCYVMQATYLQIRGSTHVLITQTNLYKL